MSLNRENLEGLLYKTAYHLGRVAEQDRIFTMELPRPHELQSLLYEIYQAHPNLLGEIFFDTNGHRPHSKELEEYFTSGLTHGSIERIPNLNKCNYIRIIGGDVSKTSDRQVDDAAAELAKKIIDRRHELIAYWKVGGGQNA